MVARSTAYRDRVIARAELVDGIGFRLASHGLNLLTDRVPTGIAPEAQWWLAPRLGVGTGSGKRVRSPVGAMQKSAQNAPTPFMRLPRPSHTANGRVNSVPLECELASERSNLLKALVKSKAEAGLWLEETPEPEYGINDVLIRVR